MATKKKAGLRAVSTVQGHNALSRVWVKEVGDDFQHITETDDWRWWDGWWAPGEHRAMLTISTLAEAAWRNHKGRPDPVTGGSVSTARGGLKFSAMRRARPLAEWDANPRVLGLGSMVLDLDAGEWREAEREDYITRCGGKAALGQQVVGEDLNLVRGFLETKLPDPEVRDWVQRWCGYCLSGDTSEQKVAWCWGDTRTGKSTLLAMMGCLLGDYAFTLPSDILKAEAFTRGAEKGYALARAPGRRLAMVSEWQKDWGLDEAFLTNITGGDVLAAREVRGKPFSFRPAFKVMVVANHMPAGTVSAPVLARLVPIPMDESHEHDPDPTLLQRLLDPGPMAAFAQWCLEGWQAYRRQGLSDLPDASQRMLASIASRAADAPGADDDIQRRFDSIFRRDDAAVLPMAEVHAKMLPDGVHISSRAGRNTTRWLASQFRTKKVRGARFYVGLDWLDTDF